MRIKDGLFIPNTVKQQKQEALSCRSETGIRSNSDFIDIYTVAWVCHYPQQHSQNSLDCLVVEYYYSSEKLKFIITSPYCKDCPCPKSNLTLESPLV